MPHRGNRPFNLYCTGKYSPLIVRVIRNNLAGKLQNFYCSICFRLSNVYALNWRVKLCFLLHSCHFFYKPSRPSQSSFLIYFINTVKVCFAVCHKVHRWNFKGRRKYWIFCTKAQYHTTQRIAVLFIQITRNCSLMLNASILNRDDFLHTSDVIRFNNLTYQLHMNRPESLK
jgi:hypothetical protein